MVGQYKLDQRMLSKLRLINPKGVILKEKFPNEEDPFDCRALLQTALEPNTDILYISRMRTSSSDERTHCYNLALQLPAHLPPSSRGRLIKIAYKIVLMVQLSNGSSTSTLCQFPLRVMPAPSLSYPPDQYADHSPPSLKDSTACSNPFWVSEVETQSNYAGPQESLLSEATGSSHEDSQTINAGHLRQSLAEATVQATTAHPVWLADSMTSEDNIDSQTWSAQPANFVISCNRGSVGRFCLLQNVFGCGDEIRGYFNFSTASVPCWQCTISLESEEYSDVDLIESPVKSAECTFVNLPHNDLPVPSEGSQNGVSRATSWSDIEVICADRQLLPVVIPVPTNITPQFCLFGSNGSNLIISYRWQLRFVFYLYRTERGLHDPEDTDAMERMVWILPIQIISKVSCPTRPASPILLPLNL